MRHRHENALNEPKVGGKPKLQRWSTLARNANYRTSKLASLCHVSVRQLERTFLVEMGRRPQDWLNEQRVLAARQLLREGRSITEVLQDLGFKQRSQFSRDFKKYHGIPPSKFVEMEENRRLGIFSLAEESSFALS